MDTKGLRVEIKDEAQGLVKAVFATFNVVDSHGDVTPPGAFSDGEEMPISSYGHTSWEGALPVGKGTIRQTSREAIFEGQFFMNTAAGRDTFETVKELGSLGQWSYGYDPLEYSFGEYDGKRVRFLNRIKVHEVSPVLVGAGVNTRTLSAKSAAPSSPPAGRPIAPHTCEVTSCGWDGAKTVAGIPDDARPSELRTVYAWVDPAADPEQKGSYRLPHHHGVGGPANVRACLMGIARLNDAKGGVPDADRKAVYEHLAAHLRDADIDPPELKDTSGGSLKYAEEGHLVMAALSTFVDRTAEVVALRAKKGRGMAPRSAELLDWIDADLKRLQALLTTPLGEEDPTEEQIASTVLAALARVRGI
jgi:HK97 family phage prohead protease